MRFTFDCVCPVKLGSKRRWFFTPTKQKPRLLEICLSYMKLHWLLWEFVKSYKTNVNDHKSVENFSTGLF